MTEGEENKKLRFIEILLIVGGIIGGLGYNTEDSSIRFILAIFLISSLMYYFEISNPRNPQFFAFLTSAFFSVLVTYPLISFSRTSLWGPDIDKILDYILSGALFIVIFLNLQEKSEYKKPSTIIYSIIGIILTWIALFWLGIIE